MEEAQPEETKAKKEESQEEEQETKSPKLKKLRKITLNTGRCIHELELMRIIIKRQGWGEIFKSNYEGDVIWFGHGMSKEDLSVLKDHSEVVLNKIPGLDVISNKATMALIMNRMKKYFKLDYNFIPRTFVVPKQHPDLLAYAKKKPGQVFIAKPPQGSQGGGICLLLASQIAKQIPVQLMQDSIIQTYVKKPLLLGKKKFDLRIYALVIANDPFIVFLSDKGLARFCTEDYDPPSSKNLHNTRMHLTNYALNKLSGKFVREDSQKMFEINEASKRELSSLWKTLELEGHNPAIFKEQIEECVIKSLIAGKPDIVNKMQIKLGSKLSSTRARFFQIVGFDIMFDQKGQGYVLEINSGPSLSIYRKDQVTEKKVISDLDLHVKQTVVEEAIYISSQKLQKILSLQKYGSYRRILPNPLQDYSEFKLVDSVRILFEQLNGGKPSLYLSPTRFKNLSKLPFMVNGTTMLKPSYDILFKNIISKGESLMTFDLFLRALQILSEKLNLFPEEISEVDKLLKFVDKILKQF